MYSSTSANYDGGSGLEAANPIVQAQIEKAVALWNECTKEEGFPVNTKDNVLSKLQAGKVPPIFHAYCAKDKKPFDKAKVISAEQVSVGQADPDRVSELSWSENLRYDDYFFDREGKAFEFVKDSGLQDKWTFCPDYTETVAALVNMEAEMVGEDVEVMQLHGKPFPMDKEASQTIVTRPLSRGVVAASFGTVKKTMKYNCAIVGSPGIGKSWTLVYALQQALLYQDVGVVICFHKEGMALTCIRKNNTLYVWTGKPPIPLYSYVFQDSNVLVLLDPLLASQGGAQYGDGKSRLILAADNNMAHFLPFNDKHSVRFLGPYTYDELKVALPFMMKLTHGNEEDEVKGALQRTDTVGMLPRYVVTQKAWEKRMKFFEEAVTKLKNNPTILKDTFEFGGLCATFNPIPGAIFAVFAAGTMEKDGTLTNVGYDGEQVEDYGRLTYNSVSEYVVEQFILPNRKTVLDVWAKRMK